MNRYIFEGEVNKESTNEMISFFKEVPNDSEGIVYFDSGGGIAMYAAILIDLLNEYPKWEVRCINVCASSASDIYLSCKNKKSIGKYFSFLLLHRSDNIVNLSGVKNPKPKTDSLVVFEAYDRISKIDDDEVVDILTEDEFHIYQNHDDVVLDYDRTIEIINYLNTLNGH